MKVFLKTRYDNCFIRKSELIWDLSDAGAFNAEWNIITNTYNSDGSLRVPGMDNGILT